MFVKIRASWYGSKDDGVRVTTNVLHQDKFSCSRGAGVHFATDGWRGSIPPYIHGRSMRLTLFMPEEWCI